MNPYGRSALTYYKAGFSPLPAIGKLLHVPGYSGKHPLAPLSDVEIWSKIYHQLNVALRLPTNVMAMDVDEYKGDLIRLKELEKIFGELPTTWNSDSRHGIGGKLLFQVPSGMKWKSNINGITIIQHTHRYVMAFPSFNKESNSMYEWYQGLSGILIEDTIPCIEDLAFLPDRWVIELEKEQPSYIYRSDPVGISIDDLDMFSDGEPCRYFQILTEMCVSKVSDAHESGLHDTGLSVIGLLITAASDGHTGITSALDQVSKAFTSARRPRDLVVEWNNLLSYVLAQIDTSSISEHDTCETTLRIGSGINESIVRNNIAKLLSAGMTTRQINRIMYGRRGR